MTTARNLPPRAIRYVLVTDQGNVIGSPLEPSSDELDRAAAGLVAIIRLVDLHCYNSTCKWQPITEPAHGSGVDISSVGATNERAG